MQLSVCVKQPAKYYFVNVYIIFGEFVRIYNINICIWFVTFFTLTLIFKIVFITILIVNIKILHLSNSIQVLSALRVVHEI